MPTNTIPVDAESPIKPLYNYLQLAKRIWPLLLGHFTNDFYANLLPALLPLALLKFDLSLAQVGFLASSFLTVGSFSQLFFGVISDRFNHFNFTLFGVGITGIFFSLAGLSSSYWLLILAVGFAGLGSAMFHPKATAETGALSPKQRGLTISLFIAVGTAGFSLGPIASATIYNNLGLEGGSWLLLAMILIALLFLVRNLSPSSQSHSKRGHVRWTEAMKILMIPWLIVVFRHVVYLSFITYTIILLEDRGISYLLSSLILSLFLLGGVIGIMVGGPLSDRFGRRPLVIISLLVALPCLLIFLHTEGIISYFFLIVGGFCLIMNNPVVVAYAQEKLPGHAGTASAITMGFGWGIGALMIGPIGILADHWGIDVTMNFVVATLVLAIIVSFLMQSKTNFTKVSIDPS